MNTITRILTAKDRLKLRLVNAELRDIESESDSALLVGAIYGVAGLDANRSTLTDASAAIAARLARSGVLPGETEMRSPEMLAWCFALVLSLVLPAAFLNHGF